MANLSSTSLPNASHISVHHQAEDCKMDDTVMSVPLAVFYSMFFVLGLAGNLLAIWVFLFVHGKKNSVHVFLVNVAVADLLLIVCLPFRMVYHSRGNVWPLSGAFCKVVGNVFYMNMYISITLLGLISVDRYIKIQRASLGRKLRSSTWSVVACGVIWTLSIAATIPMAMFSDDNEDPDKCFQYRKRQGAKGKAYFNCFLVALFWLVFLSLVVSYGKIAFKLLGSSREKPDLPNAQRYSRTAKKSFFVLFLFTVCFVPYHAFRSFYIHSQIHEMPCSWISLMDRTNEVVLLFSTFNSCLDPVMYFLLSGSIRKATLQILNNVFHCKPNEDTSSSESRRPSMFPASSTPRPSAGLISPLHCNQVVQSNLPMT